MLSAYFHVIHMSTHPAALSVAQGLRRLLAISREFGKSVDWLLTGEDKNKK